MREGNKLPEEYMAARLAEARATIHDIIELMQKEMGYEVFGEDIERAEEIYSNAQLFLENIIEEAS